MHGDRGRIYPGRRDRAIARTTCGRAGEYETLRLPRANRAVLGSRMRAKENHLASPWRRLVRDTKFLLRDRFGTDKTAFQAAWLYAYDVAEEPIVRADDAHAAGTIAAK